MYKFCSQLFPSMTNCNLVTVPKVYATKYKLYTKYTEVILWCITYLLNFQYSDARR